MDYVSVFFIAIGLSMDAFAVSMTSGCLMKRLRLRHALRSSVFFGSFQAIMPIVGWFAGYSFKRYIEAYDHWVAFVILSIIGGKMIWEASFLDENGDEKRVDTENIMLLLGLSIATSIDALAVGVTFSLLKANIFISAILIGIVTFFISLSGVYIGCRFKGIFRKKAEILGGVVLIAIGVKILIEHTLL